MIEPRHVLGGAGYTPPSETLNIAGIGVGGMGAGNMRNLESQNIVALCDVDHAYAAKTFERYPNAKIYYDFRKMLDEQKDIDAVMIATPDHTHAIISMEAMKRGKTGGYQNPLGPRNPQGDKHPRGQCSDQDAVQRGVVARRNMKTCGLWPRV